MKKAYLIIFSLILILVAGVGITYLIEPSIVNTWFGIAEEETIQPDEDNPSEDTGETEEPEEPSEDTGETDEPGKITYVCNVSDYEFYENKIVRYFGNDAYVELPSSYSIDDEGNFIEGDDYQVTVIGENIFNYSETLKSVILPTTIVELENNAFDTCFNLESVILNEGLETIGSRAFLNCDSLLELYIPSSVTSIGEVVIGSGLSLETIVVSLDNSVYDSRENCNAIIETATNTLVVACSNTTIPSTVTAIDGAYYTLEMTSLVLPENVIELSSTAFLGSTIHNLIISNETQIVDFYDAYLNSLIDYVYVPETMYQSYIDYFTTNYGSNIYGVNVTDLILSNVEMGI